MTAAWPAIDTLLVRATPPSWVTLALERWQDLLLDHANCEKKAASTAIALLFQYPHDALLTQQMARIAREELRHFEQVSRLMQELAVPFRRLSPGRYAQGLRANVRTREPERRCDLLLMGALIEARSCERFRALAPRLPGPIGEFYAALERAEARHYEHYLHLAGSPGDAVLRNRLQQLAQLESELACAPDPLFRFHSGAPCAD